MPKPIRPYTHLSDAALYEKRRAARARVSDWQSPENRRNDLRTIKCVEAEGVEPSGLGFEDQPRTTPPPRSAKARGGRTLYGRPPRSRGVATQPIHAGADGADVTVSVVFVMPRKGRLA